MNAMKKEVVNERMSVDAVRALDVSKVMAIAYAEVGAQGDPGSVQVISDLPDKVSVISGNFGFESLGTRFPEDVGLDELERVFPFLTSFRGTSVETIQRGNFAVDDEWLHADATFGNHFFIRFPLVEGFVRRLGNRRIIEAGVEAVADMLSDGEGMRRKADKGMIGAIVGDVVGSRFEWHNRKSKKFTFLKGKEESSRPCHFTDDTAMTLAVADAIMKWRAGSDVSHEALSAQAVKSMQDFGRRYPHVGYGGNFFRWLNYDDPQPYNSWGNGSAMRVSACGWAGQTLDEVKAISRAVTEVTHSHPEGIKGAEATAVATFLARTGKSMEEIRAVIVRDYYPLDFTLDEIRPTYEFDVSCQGSVPQALEAFFESTSFEDAIRNAISIGGDSDTIGAICGAVAGAYYGVPSDIRAKTETFLPPDLLETLHAFDSTIGTR